MLLKTQSYGLRVCLPFKDVIWFLYHFRWENWEWLYVIIKSSKIHVLLDVLLTFLWSSEVSRTDKSSPKESLKIYKTRILETSKLLLWSIFVSIKPWNLERLQISPCHVELKSVRCRFKFNGIPRAVNAPWSDNYKAMSLAPSFHNLLKCWRCAFLWLHNLLAAHKVGNHVIHARLFNDTFAHSIIKKENLFDDDEWVILSSWSSSTVAAALIALLSEVAVIALKCTPAIRL